MKRISFFLMTALLMAPVVAPAQDAAVEERLNSLSAQMDVLKEAKELQNKRIEALEKQVSDLQAQLSKPSGDYASTDELKKVADAIKEVDKKRQADSENVADQLEKLRKALLSGGGTSGGRRGAVTPPADAPKTTFDPATPHMEHKVESGETIDAIVKAYREKGVKITRAQVLAANPGLKPETLKAGQTIIIPAPAP
jgi:LysM repeat protein